MGARVRVGMLGGAVVRRALAVGRGGCLPPPSRAGGFGIAHARAAVGGRLGLGPWGLSAAAGRPEAEGSPPEVTVITVG